MSGIHTASAAMLAICQSLIMRLEFCFLCCMLHYWFYQISWNFFLGWKTSWNFIHKWRSSSHFCLLLVIPCMIRIVFKSLFIPLQFSMSSNRPYHKSCYREKHHPRCDVCKNFVSILSVVLHFQLSLSQLCSCLLSSFSLCLAVRLKYHIYTSDIELFSVLNKVRIQNNTQFVMPSLIIYESLWQIVGQLPNWSNITFLFYFLGKTI